MSILSKIEEIRKIQKEIDIYYLETENNYSPQRNIIYKALWKLDPTNNHWRVSLWDFRILLFMLPISLVSIPPMIISKSLIITSTFIFTPLIFIIFTPLIFSLIQSVQKSFDNYTILNLLKNIENEDFMQSNSTFIMYEFLSLKEYLKLNYLMRESEESKKIRKVIDNIINKLSFLNKKANKEFLLLKNNNEEEYPNRFKKFHENILQLYVNEEDIVQIFKDSHINLSFIVKSINLELKVVQKHIPLIQINKENLQYLIDYCNTDYYKNNIELFFIFVEKEQVEDNCFELIEKLIGFEKTQKIMNEKDNREKHTPIETLNAVNTEIFKTLKMNGKNYE